MWGARDRIAMYLIMSAVRALRYYKSSNWEQATALVTGHIVLDPCLGCPSVKLHYKFDFNGHSTNGWDVIPFTWVLGAKAYAESFPHNLPRAIRVNPRNPQETRFFERDQKERSADYVMR